MLQKFACFNVVSIDYVKCLTLKISNRNFESCTVTIYLFSTLILIFLYLFSIKVFWVQTSGNTKNS